MADFIEDDVAHRLNVEGDVQIKCVLISSVDGIISDVFSPNRAGL
jgi:hypothetical protein